MDDKRIVDLFLARDERAIGETAKKYRNYCHAVAMNVLNSESDADECVNDTYLKAWESIPPHKPTRLSVFLGKLTRNLALNRYAFNRAEKRLGCDLILDELAEVIADPDSESVEDSVVLRDAINGFLATLDKRARIIFVRRYWYMSSVVEIARRMGMTENNVKVTLLRTRNKFRDYLEKEGITV